MRRSLGAVLLWAQLTVVAATDASTPPATIIERGPFYRVWQRQVLQTNAVTGEVTTTTSAYTELANGLHYWDGAGWAESQALIEATTDGAEATHGQHKVSFAANLNGRGAVRLTSPQGQPFVSQVIGLAYFDAASGRSVLFAPVQNSFGELYPPNQLVYPNAFGDAVLADVRYTYAPGGFEQEVILRGKPKAVPQDFGFDPATTRLEVWTEFLEAPANPARRSHIVQAETDAGRRAQMVEPDLRDEILDFGDLLFPVGAAFAVGDGPVRDSKVAAEVRLSDPDGGGLCVGKRWLQVDGRQLLVEAANWPDVNKALAALPQTAAVTTGAGRSAALTSGRKLPLARTASARSGRVRTASLPYSARGFVLDYFTLSGGVSSYTFASNATYYISSGFGVGPGTNTIQLNATIKSAPNAYFYFYGPVVCPASGTTPAAFTSKDDDLFGEKIVGSTGLPSFSALPALWAYYHTNAVELRNLRIRWAQKGLQFDTGSDYSFTHALRDTRVEYCQLGFGLLHCALTLDNSTKCGLFPDSYTDPYHPVTVYGSLAPADCDVFNRGVANTTYRQYRQQEPAVAVKGNNIVVVAMNIVSGGDHHAGLVKALSSDGGSTWTATVIADGNDGMAQAFSDPALAYDIYGNLFLTYLTREYNRGMALYVSIDNGLSFALAPAFPMAGTFDLPRLATGPSGTGTQSVWLSVYNPVGVVSVFGTTVTGLGVGSVSGNWQSIQIPNSAEHIPSSIAVGPSGQVVVAHVSMVYDFTSILGGPPPATPPNVLGWASDSNGLADGLAFQDHGTFPINLGFGALLPACDEADLLGAISPFPCLAWDASSRNRLYLTYADRPTPSNTNNVDVLLRISTDAGVTWSSAFRVNSGSDDQNGATQFHPRVVVDPLTGVAAVSWLDCRLDPNNAQAHFYAAVSGDGFTRWPVPNVRLTSAASSPGDYGDYTGLACISGFLFPVWATRANTPAIYPDGLADVDTCKIAY